MKICPRYLSPKSPFSERGLAIAPLQIFVCYYFYLLFVLSGAFATLSLSPSAVAFGADFAPDYLFFRGIRSVSGVFCYRAVILVLAKRSFKICDQVIDVLDADAEAEHVRVHTCCDLFLRAEL